MPRLHQDRTVWMLLLIIGWALAILPPLAAVLADPQHRETPARGPVRITMEALHAAGGVPPGWQFRLPEGDAEAGREVFITMQCYTCHNVAGETFPAHPPREGGPDLTGMGTHHPAAYFAESIINPNAVIVTGEGYTGPDGLSRMPEYFELTIAQLIDLVAYLKSLREPMPHAHHGHQGHMPASDEGHRHGNEGHTSHSHPK